MPRPLSLIPRYPAIVDSLTNIQSAKHRLNQAVGDCAIPIRPARFRPIEEPDS